MTIPFGTPKRTEKTAEERLDALLLEGIESGEAIEVTPEYWEEKKRRLAARQGKAGHSS
jgi:antitoxin ParD1/3/4